ncbi:MAG: fatty acid desaturase [Verrucomicrobia bacterium]|nr:MAG: fatty acid desaturase [Verrucomicrobiota bacterium]
MAVARRANALPGGSWKETVRRYHQPANWRGIWQLLNTLLPYIGLWYLMYRALAVSAWLTVPLVPVAGAFLLRIFIIFHDCTHGSFFKSRRTNELLGSLLGVLCFTPYYRWRWEHSIHHASAGDLDRRGTGDIWTMTVREYLEASRWKRFAYRLARNPFILFVIAPLVLFLFLERLPGARAARRERLSVHATNAALVLMAIGLSWLFGWKAYLLLQVCIVMVAGSAGVWLFYVQHQFEGVYWERSQEWDYEKAAMQGSSYYKLPRVLQWFSGNIGFHHIHHLSPRIPNYNLERCHKSEPLFRTVKPVTLLSSLKSFNFRLWDERRRRMVGYPSPTAKLNGLNG